MFQVILTEIFNSHRLFYNILKILPTWKVFFIYFIMLLSYLLTKYRIASNNRHLRKPCDLLLLYFVFFGCIL